MRTRRACPFTLDDAGPVRDRLLVCALLMIELGHFRLQDIPTFALRAWTVTRFFYRPEKRRIFLKDNDMELFGWACAAWPNIFLSHMATKGCLPLMKS